MIVQLSKALLAAIQISIAVRLCMEIAFLTSRTESYSGWVLLGVVLALIWLGIFTYSRFFENSLIVVRAGVAWFFVLAAFAPIIFVYLLFAENSAGGERFSRLAPVPALLAIFHAFGAVTTVVGEKYLGPLRSILRVGVTPKG
jgi:hypothetical protein